LGGGGGGEGGEGAEATVGEPEGGFLGEPPTLPQWFLCTAASPNHYQPMHHSGKDCRRRCTAGRPTSRNSKEEEQLIHKLPKCVLFFSFLSHVSGNQVQVTLTSVKKPSWDGAAHLIHVETPKSPSSPCLYLNSERGTDSRHTDSRLWKPS